MNHGGSRHRDRTTEDDVDNREPAQRGGEIVPSRRWRVALVAAVTALVALWTPFALFGAGWAFNEHVNDADGTTLGDVAVAWTWMVVPAALPVVLAWRLLDGRVRWLSALPLVVVAAAVVDLLLRG
jgi:hypothetical protein